MSIILVENEKEGGIHVEFTRVNGEALEFFAFAPFEEMERIIEHTVSAITNAPLIISEVTRTD